MANFQIGFVNADGSVLSDGTAVAAYNTSGFLVESTSIGTGAAPTGEGVAVFMLLSPGTEYNFSFPNLNIASRSITLPDTPYLVVGPPGANGTDGSDGAGATITTSEVYLSTDTVNLPVQNSKAFVFGQSVALNVSDSLTLFGTVSSASDNIITVNFYASNDNGTIQSGITTSTTVPVSSTLTFGNPQVSLETTTTTTTTPSPSSTLAANYSVPQPTTTITYVNVPGFGEIPIGSTTTYPDGDLTSIVVTSLSTFAIGDYIVVGPNDLSGAAVVICITALASSTNTITGTYQDYYVENWNATTINSGQPVTLLTIPEGAITVLTGRVVSSVNTFNLPIYEANFLPYSLFGVQNTSNNGFVATVQALSGGPTTNLGCISLTNSSGTLYAGQGLYEINQITPSTPIIESVSYSNNLISVNFKGSAGAAFYNLQYTNSSSINTNANSLNLLNSPYDSENFGSTYTITTTPPSSPCVYNLYALDVSGNYASSPAIFYWDGTNVTTYPSIVGLPAPPIITSLVNSVTSVDTGASGDGIDDSNNITSVLPTGDNSETLITNFGTGRIAFSFTTSPFFGINNPQKNINSVAFYSDVFALVTITNPVVVLGDSNGFPSTTVLASGSSELTTNVSTNSLTIDLSTPIDCTIQKLFFLIIDASSFDASLTIPQSDGWAAATNEGNIYISSTGTYPWTIPSMTYSGVSIPSNPPAVKIYGNSVFYNFEFSFGNNIIYGSGVSLNTYALYESTRTLLGINNFASNEITPNEIYVNDTFELSMTGILGLELTASNDAGQSGPSSRIRVDPIQGLSWF